MRTDLPLREITTEEIYKDVQKLRSELQTHNHLDIGNAQVLTGTLNGITQSSNFVSGSAGARINWATGNVEFNSGVFRGDISGASGTFTGAISIGSGNNIFKADANGIYLGHATFASAPFRVTMAGALTATSVTIPGYSKIYKGTFGGDGSDGALAITTGTTTLDMAGAQVYIKNYSSISITGDGKLAFSNPHANGTIIILKSQGDVVLTSSDSACIDASGMGSEVGKTGTWTIDETDDHFGASGDGGPPGGAGGAILTSKTFYTKTLARVNRKAIFIACGSAGGSGRAGYQAGGGAGGVGGRGGGCLMIECAGDLNFTGTISVAGKDGSNGSNASSYGGGGGGGGGGSAGMITIFYTTATSAAGTKNTIGGAGGASGDGFTGGTTAGGPGGGGGGSYHGAGGQGGSASAGNPGISGFNAGGLCAGAGGGGGGGVDGTGGLAGAVGGTAGASDNLLIGVNTAF